MIKDLDLTVICGARTVGVTVSLPDGVTTYVDIPYAQAQHIASGPDQERLAAAYAAELFRRLSDALADGGDDRAIVQAKAG